MQKGNAMTEAELKAIEERANAATKGPWLIEGRTIYALETGRDRIGRPQVRNRFSAGLLSGPDTPNEEIEANVGLIAAARSDVPALLAEVRKLRAVVERLVRRADEMPELERLIHITVTEARAALASSPLSSPTVRE